MVIHTFPDIDIGVDMHTPIQAQALGDMFADAALRFAAQPCVDFLGRVYSYQHISDLVDRAAEGFRRLGVSSGVKVGICLPNTPYYVICYFAVLKCGGTVVNFNPLYSLSELLHQIQDSETQLMVTIDLKLISEKIEACLRDGPLDTVIVCSMREALPPLKAILFGLLRRKEISKIPDNRSYIAFSELISQAPTTPFPKIEPSALAVLQYTGGTTGQPKGAMLTHKNLSANIDQLSRWIPNAQLGQEVTLCVLPFFHVFAMSVALNTTLKIGGELVLHPKFELKAVLKTIAKKGVTIFPGVPTLYSAINSVANIAKYDLSSLGYCISGGAPLPVEVKRKFEDLTGATLVEGYGLSEASPVCCANPIHGENKAGSIGLPIPGTKIDIRSLEDVEETVKIGERGEICVFGPQVMEGYWRNPDATSEALIGGWLRTGDVGFQDEEGYTYLVDRLKDIIICSGYNVYPRTIEEALYTHPSVAEVIVIGVPDSYRGEAPKAFVKLQDGCEKLTEDSLKAYLADRLSKIELPREIEFRSDLPKTMIGKLSKKELRDTKCLS